MALFQHFPEAKTGEKLLAIIKADPDHTYCVQGSTGDGYSYLVTENGHIMVGFIMPTDTIVDSFLVV